LKLLKGNRTQPLTVADWSSSWELPGVGSRTVMVGNYSVRVISAGLRQFVTYQYQLGEVNKALSKVLRGVRSLGSKMVRLPDIFLD
jgi:hypothetical protein